MFLVDFLKNYFGYKSAFLIETEKEIAHGEDIVETVRALRVIRRSPYFAIKRILGEQPVDEEVASIQAKIKEVEEFQS